MSEALLTVNNLCLYTENSRLLKGISLSIDEGSRWAIVGESGAGKTLTMHAISGILPNHISRTGEIYLGNNRKNLLNEQSDKSNEIAIILQDSIDALNPYLTISQQWKLLSELYGNVDPDFKLLTDTLKSYNFHNPNEIIHKLPDQLSGGMRQRISIAFSLSKPCRLLICDEPTTSLDTISQRKTIELILDKCNEHALTLLYITHNLAIAKSICSHVAIMRNGEIVEQGHVTKVFENPSHSYTKKLLTETQKLWQIPTGDIL